MSRMFIGHDLGTSSNKAVLVDASGELLGTATASYPLHHPRPGFAEQDPADWWRAVCETTRAVLSDSGVAPEEIEGVCFAGQMLALVPVDHSGRPTRPAISWMDARAAKQAQRLVRRLGGERVVSMLAGGSPSGKDLIPKITWIAEEEPQVFSATDAFCDATGYLVGRATGKVRIDPTAAGGTGIYLAKKREWSRLLATLTAFPLNKMPEVVPSSKRVGALTVKAAEELGLAAGTSVTMGMADIPAAAVGSGAVGLGDAHVYLGTSAWIAVTIGSPKAVWRSGIASVPAADRSNCLLIGESETAGACRDWLVESLELASDRVDEVAASAPPGSRNLIFCPWLFGERSPVSDENLRGGFVNLGLGHGRPELARAVLEGVALNLRWTLDAMGSVKERCPKLRAIGGGARSDLWLQILADVTGRPVERVRHAQLAGAIGSALMAAVATNALPSVRSIASHVQVESRFEPNRDNEAVYGRLSEAFRSIQRPLSALGRKLCRE